MPKWLQWGLQCIAKKQWKRAMHWFCKSETLEALVQRAWLLEHLGASRVLGSGHEKEVIQLLKRAASGGHVDAMIQLSRRRKRSPEKLLRQALTICERTQILDIALELAMSTNNEKLIKQCLERGANWEKILYFNPKLRQKFAQRSVSW